MKVKELLTDESKWTKKAWTRNGAGEICGVNAPEACCWCLSGAIDFCYSSFREKYEIVGRITRELRGVSLFTWNDSVSFKEVRTLIEKLDI